MKPSLIFDLDGTLVDSLPGIAASLNRTLTAHGLPAHSNAAVRTFVGNGLRMLIQRAAPAGSPPELIESLIRLFKKDYDLSWADGTTRYPSIHHTLRELQREGYQLAVLSNKTHDFTRTIAREMFPLIHFTLVLGQQEGAPHKPHPSGALKIADAMGAAPRHCVIIGDSATDLETAANAGMHAIAVGWGYQDADRLRAAGARRVAANPSDLPRLLATFDDW